MKYFKRLLALPFIFGILFLTHLFFVCKRSYKFMIYGGYLRLNAEKESDLVE